MNVTVILFLAMNSAPGIKAFSKVIYDVPANLYMVSKPILIVAENSKLINVFITSILCWYPKNINHRSAVNLEVCWK